MVAATKGFNPKQRWKWAIREIIVNRVRKKGGFDVQKIIAVVRTMNNMSVIKEQIAQQNYQQAMDTAEIATVDVESGRIADNHLIQDLARVCINFGIRSAKKGRVRFGTEMVKKASRIFEWFADRLERMLKTLSSVFGFSKKSETPTFVLALESLITSAYGFLDSQRGHFENAAKLQSAALKIERQIFQRNQRDFMSMDLSKKLCQDLGSGNNCSMALLHLHYASALTSMKEFYQAREEAHRAVKYMKACMDKDLIQPESTEIDSDVRQEAEYLYATACYNLGVGEVNIGKYAEGVGEFYRAYTLCKQLHGEGHARTRRFKQKYCMARKSKAPGLGQYPILSEHPEREPRQEKHQHHRHHRYQFPSHHTHHHHGNGASLLFPESTIFKAYSRTLESSFLLPYSYSLNQPKVHVPATPSTNSGKSSVLHNPFRRRLSITNRPASNPASFRETRCSKKNRRPSTASPSLQQNHSPLRNNPARPNTAQSLGLHNRQLIAGGTIRSARKIYFRQDPYMEHTLQPARNLSPASTGKRRRVPHSSRRRERPSTSSAVRRLKRRPSPGARARRRRPASAFH